MPLHRLDNKFRPWAVWILDVARRNNLRPQVTSTYRSASEQRRMRIEWEMGMRKYPVARAGCSMHGIGYAIDFIAEDLPWLGMVWNAYGGQWGGTRDPVHFGARGKLCP